MRPSDIVRAVFGMAPLADVAEPADARMGTGAVGLQNFADRCGYTPSGPNVRKFPQRSANHSTRIGAGDPQHPQVPQVPQPFYKWSNSRTPWMGVHRTAIAPEAMERAIEWLNWLSSQGIAVEAESSGALHLFGLDSASHDVWQEAQALVICHANELRVALQAEVMAAASIRKAADPCGGCRRSRHGRCITPTSLNGQRLMWCSESSRCWSKYRNAQQRTKRKDSK
ncbi:hypothetical protein THIARS_70882 [Thiomonas delicata]|uniref:Uncharacterized protein n=1 Tax=Thiomonas delicata TaxID=364030 RepID=A0A238D7W6_THIDL|nr:hypothetical protein THIARS_70882 [Thiomonas delicata]